MSWQDDLFNAINSALLEGDEARDDQRRMDRYYFRQYEERNHCRNDGISIVILLVSSTIGLACYVAGALSNPRQVVEFSEIALVCPRMPTWEP